MAPVEDDSTEDVAVHTDDATRLRVRWEALCCDLGVGTAVGAEWWALLEGHYGEKHRRYHTLAHLSEMFGYFEEHSGSIAAPSAVSLAVFFHDVIYAPRAGSPKNEADSAVVFSRFAQEALPAGDPPGLAKGELIAKVMRWIVQTATHRCEEADEVDCKLFMDFDMAVLGRDWEEYHAYSHQIRDEYIHVPEATYCKARQGFLETTAKGPPIFATEAFREKLEAKARENMAKEAVLLTARFERCGAPARLGTRLVLGLMGAGKPLKLSGALGALAVLAGAAPTLAYCLSFLAAALVGVPVSVAAARTLFGSKYVRFPYPVRSKEGIAVLAGSYNPAHLGHLDMLGFLSTAHSTVYAVIGVNPKKKYAVSPYVRQELLRMMLTELGLTNVRVVVCSGIIWKYAKSVGATALYRGIRTWKEDGCGEKFLEFQNILAQYLSGCRPIPTVYLQANPGLVGLSSTLLRKRLEGDLPISDIVTTGSAAAVVRAYGPAN